MNYPSYSVAIRTLGTAGEMFEREIRSLTRQTLRPDGIFAYIPAGYVRPVFPGSEAITWVESPKGMIAQRALPFSEIKSDFILFLDDDLELAPDTVQRLFDGLLVRGGDAIVADVFHDHTARGKARIFNYLFGTHSFRSPEWGFKIRRSSYYSFNSAPPAEVMLAQSGAGPCSLVRKSTYLAIDFAQEKWMEQCFYCFGDDQLFFNKMHVNGHRLLVHYNSGAVHLDANTSGGNARKQLHRDLAALRYIMWHRTCYLPSSGAGRLWSALCFWGVQLTCLAGDAVMSVRKRHLAYIPDRFRGIADGMKFTRGELYKALKQFKATR